MLVIVAYLLDIWHIKELSKDKDLRLSQNSVNNFFKCTASLVLSHDEHGFNLFALGTHFDFDFYLINQINSSY